MVKVEMNENSCFGAIEAWGRGIEKIARECQNHAIKPPLYDSELSGLMLTFRANPDHIARAGSYAPKKPHGKGLGDGLGDPGKRATQEMTGTTSETTSETTQETTPKTTLKHATKAESRGQKRVPPAGDSSAEKASGGLGKGLGERLGNGFGERLGESAQTKVLRLISANPTITIVELSKQLGISTTAIEKTLKRLKAREVLRRVGSARSGHWEVLI